MSKSLKDGLSVLICCRNSAECIGDVLESIKQQNPGEIIIVDGNSKDETIEIAKKFTSLIYNDEGKGLGYARKLGVSKSSYKYICIISPDDLISENFISTSLQEIKNCSHETVALLARKKFSKPKSFWDKGQDAIYKLVQTFPIRVVGNPSIYKTNIFGKFSYDITFNANEDTDLCERWARAGYQVEWAKNLWTIEIENRDYKGFKERYQWYGEGDYRFVKKWFSIDKNTSFRHFFHPFKNYMIKYPFYLILKGRFGAALFSFLCGINRYKGFLNEFLTQR